MWYFKSASSNSLTYKVSSKNKKNFKFRTKIPYLGFSFFQLLYLESDCFIRSLTYSSQFSPTWNLGSLLGLSQVPVFSQASLLVLDYRWSQNLPTYRRTATPAGIEPTSFRNLASKIAGLQVHATTLGLKLKKKLLSSF